MIEKILLALVIFNIIMVILIYTCFGEEYGMVDLLYFTDGGEFVFCFEPLPACELEYNVPQFYLMGDYYYPVVTRQQFEQYLELL